MEIRLIDVEPMVDIAIRTQFSHYIFRITEPRARKGFLSGGRLGTKQHEAFLACTFRPTNFRTGGKLDQLETGHRALFYLDGSSTHTLTTSVITELGLVATQAAAGPAGDC
jgi:hypothetical protein